MSSKTKLRINRCRNPNIQAIRYWRYWLGKGQVVLIHVSIQWIRSWIHPRHLLTSIWMKCITSTLINLLSFLRVWLKVLIKSITEKKYVTQHTDDDHGASHGGPPYRSSRIRVPAKSGESGEKRRVALLASWLYSDRALLLPPRYRCPLNNRTSTTPIYRQLFIPWCFAQRFDLRI